MTNQIQSVLSEAEGKFAKTFLDGYFSRKEQKAQISAYIVVQLHDLIRAEIEEIEGMKKVHKEFECNGANNGRGCYETFCEDQDCRNAPKEWNSALTAVQERLKSYIK